jgi:ribonuclease D
MWTARDRMARTRDVAPGRVLPDSAIMDAVLNAPADTAALIRLPIFSGPRIRRTASTWLEALRSAAALPDDELPAPAGPSGDGLPPPNRWAERDPVAAARLARVRAELSALAAEHTMPVENLLEPALSRRIAWSPPDPLTVSAVEETLRAGGARAWQRELTRVALSSALVDPEPDPTDEADEAASPVPERTGGRRAGRGGGAGGADRPRSRSGRAGTGRSVRGSAGRATAGSPVGAASSDGGGASSAGAAAAGSGLTDPAAGSGAAKPAAASRPAAGPTCGAPATPAHDQ